MFGSVEPLLLPTTAGHPAAAANPTIAAYAGAPVVRTDGSVFGTLCVADPQEQPLAPEHASLLVVLAQLLTSHLARERQAHLEGVLLAARTFEHELNSALTSSLGYTQLLARDPELPRHLRVRAERAVEGSREAAAIIQRLLRLTEAFTVTDWGPTGRTTIDLNLAPRKPAA